MEARLRIGKKLKENREGDDIKKIDVDGET